MAVQLYAQIVADVITTYFGAIPGFLCVAAGRPLCSVSCYHTPSFRGKEARNNYINIFALSLIKKGRESLNPLSWELRSVERRLTMAVLGLIPGPTCSFSRVQTMPPMTIAAHRSEQ